MVNPYRKYQLQHVDERDMVIQGCRENDRGAQEVLYRHFFPVMERMIKRYSQDEDEIIDILNNGFLKVFKKIDTFKGAGSFEGWIRKIMYHSVSDYFRKHRKDVRFLFYEGDSVKEPSTAEIHDLYYQDLMKMVYDLPEKQMRVFTLFAIEGYSHEEISKTMDINKNTSRWYLAEARKSLQKSYMNTRSTNYNEAK